MAEIVVTAPSTGPLSYQGQWWIESLVPAVTGGLAGWGFSLLGTIPGVVGGAVVGIGTGYVLTYDLNQSNESAATNYSDAFGWYNPYEDERPEFQP